MGAINIVKTIKLIHESTVVLVKTGNFYNVYGKDSYIFSFLFKYKIMEKENVPTCCFPASSLRKVENCLEKNKINYLVVDKRNNYEEEEKWIDKQENNYDKIFEKSKKNVELLLRVEKIRNSLIRNIKNKNIENKLDKIEMVLNKND